MTNSKSDWLHTGDLGQQTKDGQVFLAGRSDQMIVSGGENVYPNEVEDILLKSDLVKEVVCVGQKDNQFGQSLKAYIKPENSMVNERDIKIWLKQKISPHQMPKEIVFVDDFPLTAVGKIDRKKLKLKIKCSYK